MPPTKITIDPELRDLCLPLTNEERANLREAIISDGCRDPIVCWQTTGNPILDGYHRQEICKGEGIPFEVRFLTLPSRQAAINWIIRNQLGRRNATEEQKAYLRGRLYNEQKGPVGGDRRSKGQSEPLIGDDQKSKGQSEPLIDTAARIAEETGVSPATVKRDAKFAEAIDELAEKSPELAVAARQGAVPKSAVPALADAPKATLNRLEHLEGTDLRQAASQVARQQTGPKPGQQKKDPRIWLELEGLIGRAKNRVDELNRQFPRPDLKKAMIAQLTLASGTLRQWKEAAQ